MAYPSSTGIGMADAGLVASCLSLETWRKDVFLLPLENPLQTPAYAYKSLCSNSMESPKFSRAMALVLGGYVTTWISGTASIVNSGSRYLQDVEKQTEQPIDNIEKLISPENFAAHGVQSARTSLHDLVLSGRNITPGSRQFVSAVLGPCLRFIPWPRFAGRNCWWKSKE